MKGLFKTKTTFRNLDDDFEKMITTSDIIDPPREKLQLRIRVFEKATLNFTEKIGTRMVNPFFKNKSRIPSITSKSLLSQSEFPASPKQNSMLLRPLSSSAQPNLVKLKLVDFENKSPINLENKNPNNFEKSEVIKNFFAVKTKSAASQKNERPSSLKQKFEKERILSAKKVTKLENHLTQVSCLSPMLKKNYLGIVKRLEEIKLKSLRDTIKAENSHQLQVKLSKLIKQKGIKSYLMEKNPNKKESIESFKERMMKMYDVVNDPKVWKRT